MSVDWGILVEEPCEAASGKKAKRVPWEEILSRLLIPTSITSTITDEVLGGHAGGVLAQSLLEGDV